MFFRLPAIPLAVLLIAPLAKPPLWGELLSLYVAGFWLGVHVFDAWDRRMVKGVRRWLGRWD
jgi:hypothetical protein